MTVVTAPDDPDTIVFARQNDFTITFPASVREGGIGFHAAHNKSAWINAGLADVRAQLRKEGIGSRSPHDRWVIVIDGDILLPGTFFPRLANLLPMLDRQKLYGLQGRRVAKSLVEFEAMRDAEPWEEGLDRHPIVIGYFNLFHLDGPYAAYPPSNPFGNSHDDARFFNLFGGKGSGKLPMSALHLGAISVNWGGRVEDLDSTTSRDDNRGMDFENGSQGWSIAIDSRVSGSGEADGLMIGLWEAGRVAVLAKRFRLLYLVDTRKISETSRDVIIEADRQWLWKRLCEGLKGVHNVRIIVKRGARETLNKSGSPVK